QPTRGANARSAGRCTTRLWATRSSGRYRPAPRLPICRCTGRARTARRRRISSWCCLMNSDRPSLFRSSPTGGMAAATSDFPMPVERAAGLLPDPSPRLVNAFRAVATRMDGLSFVNPALAVEAVGFAPWQGHWLGVMLTPWFMNLTLAPRDLSVWHSLKQGGKRRYRFPAGDYDFIGAQDDPAGEYQLCSL